MSSIPKPKAVRAQKTIIPDSELDTLEHQQVLDWLWSNLDRLMPMVLYTKHTAVDESIKKAIAAYGRQVEETLRAYQHCAKTADDQEHVPALKLAIKRVEKHLSDVRTTLPPLPDDANITTVTCKHYQQEITVRKYDRRGDGRDEVVGYIDIEADLSMFDSCQLHGCPIESFKFIEAEWFKPSAEEYSKKEIEPAAWEVSRITQRVWFDVRGTLPATGVLVRELRVLQELAGPNVIVVLVAADFSESLKDLLQHEGFWFISQSEATEWLADHH